MGKKVNKWALKRGLVKPCQAVMFQASGRIRSTLYLKVLYRTIGYMHHLRYCIDYIISEVLFKHRELWSNAGLEGRRHLSIGLPFAEHAGSEGWAECFHNPHTISGNFRRYKFVSYHERMSLNCEVSWFGRHLCSSSSFAFGTLSLKVESPLGPQFFSPVLFSFNR